MARHLGAEEDDEGNISSPKEDPFLFWVVMIALAVLFLFVLIFAPNGL